MTAPLRLPITTVLIRILCGCVGPRDCQMERALGIFLQLRTCDPLCGTVGCVFAPCMMHSRHKVPQKGAKRGVDPIIMIVTITYLTEMQGASRHCCCHPLQPNERLIAIVVNLVTVIVFINCCSRNSAKIGGEKFVSLICSQ